MPWNPEVYNQFKDVRYLPFFDLIRFISPDGLKKAIDIGCGTGEQTHILSERFPDAEFLGIDSSAEMLAQSEAYKNKRLNFKREAVEELYNSTDTWDLIFSSAALQWSDKHEKLFPKLLSLLSENGQFAIQMPLQAENILNQILFQLASEEPYKSLLQNWNRISPVLSLDEYSKMIFQYGVKDLQISIKVYPIIAENAEKLFQFISGSALIPYLERLEGNAKQQFIEEYKKRIAEKFTKFPAIYAFKRILLYGRK
ncbi:methyltransferase domain-containing protein [Chryseobacterium sp. Y16C]|uniref:methyltransferase domain-containing protein n=1 Tax=Chryseobacterium sp. Y16C TaxID=2920939 RepID=UPI001F0AD328|nr:methyltransferase domain-containing protein [Chryseobacterium sp. Y16C]UMQ40055.1 methyltransferase domain-containing protein [Chryseobacterium sp. Y16C]